MYRLLKSNSVNPKSLLTSTSIRYKQEKSSETKRIFTSQFGTANRSGNEVESQTNLVHRGKQMNKTMFHKENKVWNKKLIRGIINGDHLIEREKMIREGKYNKVIFKEEMPKKTGAERLSDNTRSYTVDRKQSETSNHFYLPLKASYQGKSKDAGLEDILLSQIAIKFPGHGEKLMNPLGTDRLRVTRKVLMGTDFTKLITKGQTVRPRNLPSIYQGFPQELRSKSHQR